VAEQVLAAWARRWAGIVAAVVLALFLLAMLLAYKGLKRPGDVVDENAPFAASEPAQTGKIVDWPTYGYDEEKTRYLPEKGIRPPFRQIWSYETGGVLTEFPPVLADATIYGVDKHAVAYALGADGGGIRWRNRVGELNASSPAYHDGRVFIVDLEPGRAMALDAETGKKVWQRDLPGRSESSPVVADGKVIFGCECGTLYAVAEKTGKLVWQRDLGGAIKGGPAVHNGLVFVDDYGGHISAVRLADGSLKWQSSSLGLSLGREGAFYSTPAVALGRVYASSKDGRMYSFVADTGKLAWSHSVGGEVYASPAVADTPASPPTVYFGTLGGRIYALEARTGKERWSRNAGGSVIGAGSVVGQIFYVANVSKKSTAGFSVTKGKRVFGFGNGAYNPVISDGRRIYLTGYSGVIALKPRPAGTSKPKKQKHTHHTKKKKHKKKSKHHKTHKKQKSKKN
jgi:outer membrane protein assembly factor BamB